MGEPSTEFPTHGYAPPDGRLGFDNRSDAAVGFDHAVLAARGLRSSSGGKPDGAGRKNCAGKAVHNPHLDPRIGHCGRTAPDWRIGVAGTLTHIKGVLDESRQ